MQAPMQKVGQQGGGESVKGFPHWISEGVSGKHKGTDTDHRTQSLQQSHGNGLLPTGGGGGGIGSCLEGPPDCQATLEETCRESLEEQGPDWVTLLKTCSLPLAWLLPSHSLGGDMDTLS